MSRILVLPQQLFRVADEFKNASIQLEWTINMLNRQIFSMMAWEGTTRQRFFEDFQRAHREMTLTIELMKSISEELRNIAGRFILFDGELEPIIPISPSQEENGSKTWQDHVQEFGEGIKSGVIGLGEFVADTGKALFEDPLGTAGQMAYNATIGTVKEVIDTGAWGTKMLFDVDDTREKFNEKINESGGVANYLGEQGVMIAGGAILGRVGVKKGPGLKYDSGGDGGGASKKDEGTSEGKNFIDTKGYRNDAPLTQEQIDELVSYADKLGFPEDNIHIADSVNTTPTSIMYDTILIINNDVLPSTISTKNPNSLISGKGTIAHEVVGHYETVTKGTAFNQYDLINNEMILNPRNYALDEAQASIRAARFAPDLSQAERIMLIRDGIQRLRNANLKIKDVRHLLDIIER
ncbi:WXG100 family type VII secretion target [Paenibacillus faecalis]|uniref:WXG100 family type VII secretion target n=1 Tax=Paenibacillus faecalis TaxID=2079532 RepID=UPI000D10791D|nr:WXG100 family type VII secretion target [Paenibacillus faecalis]